MFADDTNITISAETAEDLEEKLNNELNNVHNWLLPNKLTVNVDKSEYMLIGSRQILAGINCAPTINLGGKNLKRGYSPFCASVLLITKVGHQI